MKPKLYPPDQRQIVADTRWLQGFADNLRAEDPTMARLLDKVGPGFAVWINEERMTRSHRDVETAMAHAFGILVGLGMHGRKRRDYARRLIKMGHKVIESVVVVRALLKDTRPVTPP